jgi:archaellum component FlaC
VVHYLKEHEELHRDDGGDKNEGRMAAELGQIERDIGALLKAMDSAEKQRETLFGRVEKLEKEIGEVHTKQNQVMHEIATVLKPAAEEFKKMKHKGIGIGLGLILATGSVSAFLAKIFTSGEGN